MANLKQDLLNNLGNEKYYEELELARLAQDPNMNYKEKIDTMSGMLKNLAALDLSNQLVGKYFPEQEAAAPAPVDGAPVEQPANAPVEGSQPHQGQTHAE